MNNELERCVYDIFYMS